MKRLEELSTETGERRRARRLDSRAHVRIAVDTAEMSGRADNISQTGILFFSEGELRVKLEIEDNGVVQSRTGRLVRAQRMRGDSIGWAIEFDPA